MPSFRGQPLDLVIDVRSKMEYLLNHLPKAENIPVQVLEETMRAKKGLKPGMAILVYCASGVRSRTAQGILTRLGFTKVIDGGGIRAAAREYRA